MVSFVSFAFISALSFKISFLLLTLGFFISSFSSCFRCRVRLFIWLVSCFLRCACIAMNFPLRTAFTVSHRVWVVVFSFSFVSMHILISFWISSCRPLLLLLDKTWGQSLDCVQEPGTSMWMIRINSQHIEVEQERNRLPSSTELALVRMCRVISCVIGRGCLLWPVPSLDKTLLAFVQKWNL